MSTAYDAYDNAHGNFKFGKKFPKLSIENTWDVILILAVLKLLGNR